MRRFLVLLVAATLALSACSDATPYAAKVNGDRISVEELHRELNAVRKNEAYLAAVRESRPGDDVLGTGRSGTFGSAFVAETLTRRIYFKLVHQEIERRKLPVTEAAVQRARDSLTQSPQDEELYRAFPKGFLDEIARTTAEVEVLRQSLEQPVSDQQVEDFYRQNPQFFRQFCTAQILTGGFSGDAPPSAEQEAAARATADDVKRRLDTGQDFAAIARAESKDAATAANGGDRGCVAENGLPPEAREAVAGAQPGQLVGPIRTDRGFYLIRLNSTTTQPVEEVAGQIRQFLEQQAGDALSNFVLQAAAEADIEVNPRYGTFAKQPRPGVVPPDLPTTSTTAPEDEAPAQ